ncbi:MAG: hypothetical protein ACXAC7_05660 [Candidatus Hodarchaeales archaeon]|jgi:hypothetical protein
MSEKENNKIKQKQRSDLQWYGYASGIPIMPIAGLFIGWYIGENLGGKPFNQIFAVLGALLFFFISVIEFAFMARKEGQLDKKKGIKSFNAFIKKTQNEKGQQSENNK